MMPGMETGLDMDVEESDLMQILSHVVEEVRHSIGRDINGAELLYGLLNAPWLQSLLKVYECLQQFLRSSTVPQLSYASGLSLEIVSDLRALPYPSQEARELDTLLTDPHLQALLSAHDVVGLKDYEPILPPLPEDLPVDEEAMRIVCLVKNKQPLKNRVGKGIRSHWDTLRELTRQRLLPAQRAQSGRLYTKTHEAPQKVTHKVAEVPSSPKPVPLRTQPYFKHVGHCKLCHQNNVFLDRGLSGSTPCVCSSLMYDDFIDGINNMDDPFLTVHPHYTLSPWTHIPRFYQSPCCYHASHFPTLSPRVARCICTAPPSPMHRHRVVEAMGNSPVDLARQESLDELRSTVQQATCRMECSSQDVQILGQRMAAATERMSESVQENAQALTILAQVVEKLQGLVAGPSAALSMQTDAAHGEEALEESLVGAIDSINVFTQSGSAHPCVIESDNAQWQGLTGTISAPQTATVHGKEASTDWDVHKTAPSTYYNASSSTHLQKIANASPKQTMTLHCEETSNGNSKKTDKPTLSRNSYSYATSQLSRAKSTNCHSSSVHSTPTRHSRCPSCSSTSSSSNNSFSILLEHPMVSQGRRSQCTSKSISPKGGVKTKPPPTPPKRREGRESSMPNGLGSQSSVQNHTDSCSGIGCLSDRKKKRKKKKK